MNGKIVEVLPKYETYDPPEKASRPLPRVLEKGYSAQLPPSLMVCAGGLERVVSHRLGVTRPTQHSIHQRLWQPNGRLALDNFILVAHPMGMVYAFHGVSHLKPRDVQGKSGGPFEATPPYFIHCRRGIQHETLDTLSFCPVCAETHSQTPIFHRAIAKIDCFPTGTCQS